MRTIVLGIAAAALTAGGSAAAWAAGPATRAASEPRAAATFSCNMVEADLSNIFARDCDSGQWGPISDFVVRDRLSGDAYQCRAGWSEGSLWINGQDCTRL